MCGPALTEAEIAAYGKGERVLTPAMIETARVRADTVPGRQRRASRVIVRKGATRGDYVVVAGHDAFHSACRNAVERIACLVRSRDPKDAEEELAEHLTIGHLHPMDEARLLDQVMREKCFSQRAMFRTYGIPPTHISKRVALLKLSPADCDLVESGRITVEAALRRARARAAPPRP